MGSGRRAAATSERGYVLLVLSLFAALIAVGLMQAIPTLLVQTQRDREEELIFRGEQYQRAIQLYVRKFGRYPNSLDDLEETNGVRFLRHRYRDPITGEEEWRLIHIGPGGTFPDSKNAINAPTQPGGLPGGTGLAPTAAGAEPRGFGPQPSQFESGASGFGGASSPAQTTPAQTTPGQTTPGQPGITPGGAASGFGQNPQQLPDALRASASPGANPAQQPRASAAAQSGTVTFGGGGIAGVASQSTDPSIKIYNGYQEYDEWEFVYNVRADQLGLAAAGSTGGVAQPGVARPGLLGQPGAPPRGVMTSRPGAPVPGVPFPGGAPSGRPRFPASQYPGASPGIRPGQTQFPGASPGTRPFPGYPGARPGTSPGNQQPQSPFAPSPFPGSSGFSNTPATGSQAPRTTQPRQGFPTSPVPGFPTNPQQRRP